MTETDHSKVGIDAYGVESAQDNGRLAPADRLICKFLLVQYQSDLRLLFGPVKIFTYHAMLLDRFCTDNVVASAWLKPKELLEVLDKNLRVRGGGWLEFQPADNSLRIFGASTAYGRFDRPALDRVLSAKSLLSPFSIRIDTV